jgi:putative transposase
MRREDGFAGRLQMENENAKLKRMYADLALENAAMKELITKKL